MEAATLSSTLPFPLGHQTVFSSEESPRVQPVIVNIAPVGSATPKVSPALAGRPFRRCLRSVTLLVSHSRDSDVVGISHDYKFDMFAARNLLTTQQTFNGNETGLRQSN